MTKKYDQRYLHTYTLFEYLHYIKEPSDIPFSTTLPSFHCLFAVGMPNIATQSGVSLYMILVPIHTAQEFSKETELTRRPQRPWSLLLLLRQHRAGSL